MRTLLPIVVAALLSASLAACTCRSADEARQAELAERRRNAIDRKAPTKRRMVDLKSATPIEREQVEVVFLDSARFAAGEEDPWVSVKRQVGPKRPIKNAIWMLFKGPTTGEQEGGLTLMSSGADGFEDFTFEDGVVSLTLRGGCDAGGSTVTIQDHLEKTLAQFPAVKAVKVRGPDGSTADPDGPGNSRPACLEP
jgi:hypothetical protein